MKVWIDEACTGCRMCEDICPDVFLVDEFASVMEDSIPGNEDAILEAAEECPVEAIIIEEDDYGLLDDEEDGDDDDDDDEEFGVEEEI